MKIGIIVIVYHEISCHYFALNESNTCNLVNNAHASMGMSVCKLGWIDYHIHFCNLKRII